MTEKRTFKTKNFNKWMRKPGLKDQDLLIAVVEMEAGLVGVDLGGGTYLRKELHYQAQAKELVPGHWLQVSLPRSGFFFTDLQRMRKIILMKMN
jgi:hypothetical protein